MMWKCLIVLLSFFAVFSNSNAQSVAVPCHASSTDANVDINTIAADVSAVTQPLEQDEVKDCVAFSSSRFGLASLKSCSANSEISSTDFSSITKTCPNALTDASTALRPTAIDDCEAKGVLPGQGMFNSCVETELMGPGSQLSRLNELRQCLKPSLQADMVCDALSSVKDTENGFSAKSALLTIAARKVSSNGVSMSEMIQMQSGHEAESSEKKEHLSNEHLEALVDTTLGGELKNYVAKLKLKAKPMTEGMMDSDEGKILAAWQEKIITPGKISDEVLNMLTGRLGRSPKVTEAFKEILAETKLKGKTYLNPELTNDQLREAFNKTPSLRAYLHEMVGFANAVQAYDSGSESKAEFKARIQTSLFHNGPDDGYWRTFGSVFLPGGLKNSKDPDATKVLQNTLFANDGVSDVHYPYTTSVEGVFHVFVDRLSQGTRGGMTKILEEVGGQALPNVDEMLFLNPLNTIRQMKALDQYVQTMSPGNSMGMTPERKKYFQTLIAMGEKRLADERVFIRDHVTRVPPLSSQDDQIKWPLPKDDKMSIQVQWPDPACKPEAHCPQLKVTIDAQTPLPKAERILKSLMIAEEKQNGDPMLELGKAGTIPCNPAKNQ